MEGSTCAAALHASQSRHQRMYRARVLRRDIRFSAEEKAMIVKIFGAAAAAALLALGVSSCSSFSKSSSGMQTSQHSSNTSASAGGTGASGPAEMGRGRCEALTGQEREQCFAEDRGRSEEHTSELQS